MTNRQAEHFLKKIWIEFSWAWFVVMRRTKSKLLFVKGLLHRPQLPENADGKVFVHLGCGDIICPEFINVDIRPAPHVHYVRDVTDLSVFRDGYADLIYACHVLEHFSQVNLKKTLWEWKRVLKPQGILRLSVPDFDKLIYIYESCSRDIMSIHGMLMGQQNHKFNVHYSAFNRRHLSERLMDIGFQEVREWEPNEVAHHDFEDTAGRTVVIDGREFSVSLNLEAVK